MKRNKHYLNVIKLIKENKPDNSAHGGLVFLLLLNLFFGGCFMSTSTSKLEKQVAELQQQVKTIKKW